MNEDGVEIREEGLQPENLGKIYIDGAQERLKSVIAGVLSSENQEQAEPIIFKVLTELVRKGQSNQEKRLPDSERWPHLDPDDISSWRNKAGKMPGSLFMQDLYIETGLAALNAMGSLRVKLETNGFLDGFTTNRLVDALRGEQVTFPNREDEELYMTVERKEMPDEYALAFLTGALDREQRKPTLTLVGAGRNKFDGRKAGERPKLRLVK